MGTRGHHHPRIEVLIDGIGRRFRPAWRITGCWQPAKAAGFLLVLGAVAACASGASTTPGVAGASTAAREGLSASSTPAVYTAQQAERGERVFSTVCSACHGRSEFSGPIFALTWMAEPVGHLFEHISTTMPEDRPGSLSGEEYAAVLAYFLRVNGREAGDVELPADAELLRTMRW